MVRSLDCARRNRICFVVDELNNEEMRGKALHVSKKAKDCRSGAVMQDWRGKNASFWVHEAEESLAFARTNVGAATWRYTSKTNIED